MTETIRKVSSIFQNVVDEVTQKCNLFLLEEVLIERCSAEEFDLAFVKIAQVLVLLEGTEDCELIEIVLERFQSDGTQSRMFFDVSLLFAAVGSQVKLHPSAMCLKGFVMLDFLERFMLSEFVSNNRMFYMIDNVRAMFTVFLEDEDRDEEYDYISLWGLGLCTYLKAKRLVLSQGKSSIKLMSSMLETAYLMLMKCYYHHKVSGKSFDTKFWYLGHVMVSPYYIAQLCLLMGKVDACRSWIIRGYIDNSLPPDEIMDNSDLKDHMPNLYLTKKFLHQNGIFERTLILESGGAMSDLTQSVMMRSALTTSTFSSFTSFNNPLDILKPLLRQTSETKQRLHTRMELYGVEPRRDIPGDGNCQFYSLSDQLTGTLTYASYIRYIVVIWLKAHGDYVLSNGCTLKDFVHDKTWDEYITEMSKNNVWGDHLTLIAAAEIFQSKVFIISSVPGDNFIVEILPEHSIPRRIIMISHEAEYHYGSIQHSSNNLRNPLLK